MPLFADLIAAFPSHFAEFPRRAAAVAVGGSRDLLPAAAAARPADLLGSVLGIVALVLAGVLIVNVGGVSIETVLF